MKQTKKRRTGLLAAVVFWLAVWQAAAMAIGQEVFLVSPIQAAGTLMELLPQVISKPQALGFIMAIMFNVPCTMTVAATYRENHSKKWIALSVMYYVIFSLTLAFLFYHIGLLIW